MLGFAQSWALWAHLIVLIVTSIIGVGAVIAICIPYDPHFSFHFSRRPRTSGYLATMAGIAVAAGAAIAAIGFPVGSNSTNSAKPIASSNHVVHPAMNILVSGSQAPGDIPPTVGCVQTVTVSGKLAPGDTIIVGNAKSSSDDYFFVPVKPVAEQPGNWTATVYFGVKSDGGAYFHLAVVAIPETLEAYMHSIYHFQREKEGAYLAGPGLPPAPAYIAKLETVVRSTSERGCTA